MHAHAGIPPSPLADFFESKFHVYEINSTTQSVVTSSPGLPHTREKSKRERFLHSKNGPQYGHVMYRAVRYSFTIFVLVGGLGMRLCPCRRYMYMYKLYRTTTIKQFKQFFCSVATDHTLTRKDRFPHRHSYCSASQRR